MTNPPTFDDAAKRGLLVDEKQGIHTFSSGSHWDGWASHNCFECWHYDPDVAGAKCAFESAAWLNMVSPDLARLFGWIQDAQYDEPNDHRHGWDEPEACPFFRSRTDDNGGDNPPPPEPDPLQLVLLADPTEDLGQVAACDPAFQPELVV